MGDPNRMPLTVWMNMPSPYQADFFRELARRNDVDLDVIFGRSLDPMRTGLGWSISHEGFESQMLSRRWRMWQGVQWAWRRRDRVHVVNGVWALPEFVAATVTLLLVGAPVFFHAEVPDPRVQRTGVRLIARDLLGKMLLRRSRGIFAISGQAERFYSRLAGNPRRVFPFGYFKRHEFLPKFLDNQDPREVLFVGQLIERKAADLLVEAFDEVANDVAHVQLKLVGSGPQEDALRAQVARLGLDKRIIVEGAVNSEKIDERIRQADVLVLPSHFDGWGLVVNEALAGGVPVIVSSACGAADLVGGQPDGVVVTAGDRGELESALRLILGAPSDFKVNAEAWQSRIGLEPVIDYFLECIKFGLGKKTLKPAPCWKAGAAAW